MLFENRFYTAGFVGAVALAGALIVNELASVTEAPVEQTANEIAAPPPVLVERDPAGTAALDYDAWLAEGDEDTPADSDEAKDLSADSRVRSSSATEVSNRESNTSSLTASDISRQDLIKSSEMGLDR